MIFAPSRATGAVMSFMVASLAIPTSMGAVLSPASAIAQESSNRVNTITDWNVFVDENPKECWAVSKPKETKNTKDGKAVSVQRGDILLFATFRPGRSPEISFTGGYPFAPGSTVDLTVGDRKFQLFTDKEWAWPGSPDDDAKLLAALRGGNSATLTARSARGTQTQDTFSLRGFTAATDDAQKRCK